MFQNVNVTKSAPFVLLTIYQKSLYPPKVFKLPPFRQITRNSPTIFRFEQREMEPSNFTANHVKITQFAAQTMNHAKSAQFLLNTTNPCSPTVPQPFFTANLAKFAQFANTQSERCEINQFRANLNKSSIFIFRLS